MYLYNPITQRISKTLAVIITINHLFYPRITISRGIFSTLIENLKVNLTQLLIYRTKKIIFDLSFWPKKKKTLSFIIQCQHRQIFVFQRFHLNNVFSTIISTLFCYKYFSTCHQQLLFRYCFFYPLFSCSFFFFFSLLVELLFRKRTTVRIFL